MMEYAEVEVTNAWWEKNKDDLAETYTERAYVDRTSYGQAVWVLRFRLDNTRDVRDLVDLIQGDHIRQVKLTNKPF